MELKQGILKIFVVHFLIKICTDDTEKEKKDNKLLSGGSYGVVLANDHRLLESFDGYRVEFLLDVCVGNSSV